MISCDKALKVNLYSCSSDEKTISNIINDCGKYLTVVGEVDIDRIRVILKEQTYTTIYKDCLIVDSPFLIPIYIQELISTIQMLNRLKLELSIQEYFTDEQYIQFIKEKNLSPTDKYNKPTVLIYPIM